MKVSFLKNSEVSNDFYPFAVLHNIEDLLLGIYSNRQRWIYLVEKGLGESIEFTAYEDAEYIIDPRLVPNQAFVNFLWNKKSSLEVGGERVVHALNEQQTHEFLGEVIFLRDKVDILLSTKSLIESDVKMISPVSNITTVIKDRLTQVYHPDNCFVGDDLITRNATLNAEEGPIYIGENVKISEYAVIYGPAIILDNTVVCPHTTIRGGCIIGENSVVSGELKNVLMLGNSNKGHYGFLGDSIIGEYCNIGAGTSCSNLKNNFNHVKLYDKNSNDFKNTEVQKVGSFIGPFSTTAVNTVFNTGTTVGLMCNIFGAVKYPKYVTCFSWGVEGSYHPGKYKETANALLSHKGVSEEEKKKIFGKLDSHYLEHTA